MRFFVKGGSATSGFYRAWLGTRVDYDTATANLPNGTLIGITDEAENSIDLTVVYPVGSIYMNATDDTNPATLFGIGTWNLIDSKFLYGANSLLSDLGDTGGATTATLVQNNLPTSLTGLTISAMTGSTSTESTDHTHTTVARTNLTTDNMSEHSSGWFHRGNPSTTGETQTDGSTFTEDLSLTRRFQNLSSDFDFYPRVHLNIQHTHSFDIPALTTGNQSEHSTHSHTVDVNSQTVNLTNVGSGTSFSILPTYRKVAIWFRQA